MHSWVVTLLELTSCDVIILTLLSEKIYTDKNSLTNFHPPSALLCSHIYQTIYNTALKFIVITHYICTEQNVHNPACPPNQKLRVHKMLQYTTTSYSVLAAPKLCLQCLINSGSTLSVLTLSLLTVNKQ